jgi:hypothetical protein
VAPRMDAVPREVFGLVRSRLVELAVEEDAE